MWGLNQDEADNINRNGGSYIEEEEGDDSGFEYEVYPDSSDSSEDESDSGSVTDVEGHHPNFFDFDDDECTLAY